MGLRLGRVDGPEELGVLLLVVDGAGVLVALDYGIERLMAGLRGRFGAGVALREVAEVGAAGGAVRAYLAGDLWAVDAVVVEGGGTGFQRAVWGALRRVPAGEVSTYGGLAGRLGTRGARAVGAANGRNGVNIVVPCHRLVGADGGMVGYGGGLARKRWLLAHEARFGRAGVGNGLITPRE